MKKSVFKCLLMMGMITIAGNLFAQLPGKYTVTGNVKNAEKVYFYKMGLRRGVSDSTVVEKGQFKFEGETKEILYATLEIVDQNEKSIYVNFFLEAGNISVNEVDKGIILASGTYDNDIYKKFQSQPENIDSTKSIQPFYDMVNRASEKLFYIRKNENPNQDSIKLYTDSSDIADARIKPFMSWYRKEAFDMMKKYPKSYFTAAILSQMYYGSDSLEVITIYNNLGTKIQEGYIAKELKKDLDRSKAMPNGTVAPDFKTKDINDKELSLSSFKGKYVLLDFWATWCAPCRASNPELIKIYKKYHDKGFEIIGIADDNKNVAGWKKAVKMDKIDIWHHVLKGGSSTNPDAIAITDLYKISVYPTQYLIDKEGKIMGQVSLSDLESTLQSLMP